MNIKTILHGLPVQPLLDSLLPEMWEDITMRQRYPGSAHADTECIFLRGPRSFLNFFAVDAQDYPRLEQVIEPLMLVLLPLLNTIDCQPDELGRVMLVKLLPRGHVKVHTDTGPYADAFQRHHVVLSTNDHCVYHCGDESAKHAAGDAFWFDHHTPHHSHNYGSTDRIHLIVDTLERRAPATDWSDLCPKN
jgi:hypothetical protein